MDQFSNMGASAPRPETPQDILTRCLDLASATEQHIIDACMKTVGSAESQPQDAAPVAPGPPNVLSSLEILERRLQHNLNLARNLNNRL